MGGKPSRGQGYEVVVAPARLSQGTKKKKKLVHRALRAQGGVFETRVVCSGSLSRDLIGAVMKLRRVRQWIGEEVIPQGTRIRTRRKQGGKKE